MNLPPDLQLRLARLSTDLVQLQCAVQELMQQCSPYHGNGRPEDRIATAQYLALEAVLHHAPEPAQQRPRGERAELLA